MTDRSSTLCSDQAVGNLIHQYELALLGDADRLRFEMHVTECAFCQHELSAMEATSLMLREHRGEMATLLDSATADQADADTYWKRASALTGWAKTKQAVLRLFLERPLVPSLAGALAVAAVFTVVVWKSSENPYGNLADLSPLSYARSQVRADDAEDSEEFQRIMEVYVRGEYGQAATQLEAYTESHADGVLPRLYYGVALCLDREGERAVKALEPIRNSIHQPQVTWYLAQAYLLAGDSKQAVAALESLKARNLEYSREATDLLAKIQAVDR